MHLCCQHLCLNCLGIGRCGLQDSGHPGDGLYQKRLSLRTIRSNREKIERAWRHHVDSWLSALLKQSVTRVVTVCQRQELQTGKSHLSIWVQPQKTAEIYAERVRWTHYSHHAFVQTTGTGLKGLKYFC